MSSKDRMKNEEFIFKSIRCFSSCLVLDGLLPHSHEFPSFKFLKEGQFFNMVVWISLNQPLTKTDKFYWVVIFIIGESFATQSVVLVWSSLEVGANFKIIRISIFIRIQIHKHSLIIILGVKKKLNVLVKITPFLLFFLFHRLISWSSCVIELNSPIVTSSSGWLWGPSRHDRSLTLSSAHCQRRRGAFKGWQVSWFNFLRNLVC